MTSPDSFAVIRGCTAPVVSAAMDWNAIAAISGAVAAVAAAIAVGLTVKGGREQRTQRRLDKRSANYGACISTPAMDSLRSYRDETRSLLKDGAKAIGDLSSSNAPHSSVLEKVADLTEACNENYFNLQGNLTVGAEAWNDPSLRNSLREAVEALQDALNPAVALLATGGAAPDLDAILNQGVARIIKILLEHDPGAT